MTKLLGKIKKCRFGVTISYCFYIVLLFWLLYIIGDFIKDKPKQFFLVTPCSVHCTKMLHKNAA